MNALKKYYRQREIEKQAQEAARRSAEKIIKEMGNAKSRVSYPVACRHHQSY